MRLVVLLMLLTLVRAETAETRPAPVQPGDQRTTVEEWQEPRLRSLSYRSDELASAIFDLIENILRGANPEGRVYAAQALDQRQPDRAGCGKRRGVRTAEACQWVVPCGAGSSLHGAVVRTEDPSAVTGTGASELSLKAALGTGRACLSGTPDGEVPTGCANHQHSVRSGEVPSFEVRMGRAMQLRPVDGQRQASKPVDRCFCHVAVQKRNQERQPLNRVRGHGNTGTIGAPHLRLERDGEAAVEVQL